jgi:hypothetical protein
LTGDEEDNQSYLKSTVFGAMISPGNPYVGDIISGSYLKGPGIKQRQFFNWAVRNDFFGLPATTIRQDRDIDLASVASAIPIISTEPDVITSVSSAYISEGDFVYWAEQHILYNHPELYNTEWVAEYHVYTNEISIDYQDDPSELISAGSYDVNAQYIVAYFSQSIPLFEEPEVVGDTFQTSVVGGLPDVSAYTQDSITNTGSVSFSLEEETTTDASYSDSTPSTSNTESTFSSESYNGTLEVYSLETNLGGSAEGEVIETSSLKSLHYLTEQREITSVTSVSTVTESVGPSTTKTTTTTVVTESLTPTWEYHTDTQVTVRSKIVNGGTQVFLYKLGTGGNPELDALQNLTQIPEKEYYPFIPVRVDNVSITDTVYQDNGIYEDSNTAYKKA